MTDRLKTITIESLPSEEADSTTEVDQRSRAEMLQKEVVHQVTSIDVTKGLFVKFYNPVLGAAQTRGISRIVTF